MKIQADTAINKTEFENVKTGEIPSTGQPLSDVLYYTLENEDKIIVRPSGTEPKIKFYFGVNGADCDAKIAALRKEFE